MNSHTSHTAHVDTFATDNLPPREFQPDFLFELPELQYPERLNCAAVLLDEAIERGWGDRVAFKDAGTTWSYVELWERANQIAGVLVEDLRLVSGNRVLLHGFNAPMTVACWFAILKAGGIVVASMPVARAKELKEVINKARVTHALFDARLESELEKTLPDCPTLSYPLRFGTDEGDGLEARMANRPTRFEAVNTSAEDVALIAFTSGTTGTPKGCMHFHRDVLAICDTFAKHVLKASRDDIFIGSPPLAFTFGLGGLVLFPMRIGASGVLLERGSPELLRGAIREFGATVCFTSPTAYRMMADSATRDDLVTLRKCVSAGEALPAATRKLWRETTGIELIDGIGATELLHIFISADETEARPGATGKPIPGYRACVLDQTGQPVPPGSVGRLAVKGPTGCRYLADPRQTEYVQDGWNLTGDAYLVDEDGYFFHQARTDDMIISAGYSIAGPEVEGALLMHDAIGECAVVGVSDDERGQIVKAYVVLREEVTPSDDLVKELQDFVKQTIAPYKYPRAIAFRTSLPRTATGKLQRYVLREQPSETSEENLHER